MVIVSKHSILLSSYNKLSGFRENKRWWLIKTNLQRHVFFHSVEDLFYSIDAYDIPLYALR